MQYDIALNIKWTLVNYDGTEYYNANHNDVNADSKFIDIDEDSETVSIFLETISGGMMTKKIRAPFIDKLFPFFYELFLKKNTRIIFENE